MPCYDFLHLQKTIYFIMNILYNYFKTPILEMRNFKAGGAEDRVQGAGCVVRFKRWRKRLACDCVYSPSS